MFNEFNVAIIDDNGDDIAKVIKDRLDCSLTNISVDRAMRSVDNDYYFARYKCILVDATHSGEDGISAIDLAEKLIYNYPNLKDRIQIILGTDVLCSLQNGNVYEKYFLSRVKELPHVLYGDNYGNKLKVIENTIKSIAKKQGIIIENKLEHGEVSEEFIFQAKKEIDKIRRISQVIKECRDYQKLSSLNFSSEEERQLFKTMEELQIKYSEFNHALNNYIFILNLAINEFDSEENINTETKKR